MTTYFKDVRRLGLCVGLLLLGVPGARAQTQTPDPTDTTYVRIALYQSFGTGSTFLGNIDVQMLTHEAPLNVANFLGYANAGTYNNSFIHRSNPGFIFQGGEYNFIGATPTPIVSNPPAVAGEHGINYPNAFSNVRGTLALALSNGPDSGTTSWFFNLVNSNFDGDAAENNLDGSAGGGPFTVFGVVANSSSLAVMDSIATVPTFDLSGILSSLGNLPLLTYTMAEYNSGTLPLLSDFIYTASYTKFTINNFNSWQAAFASDPNAATDSLPTATPQNDGVPNLVKYALGVTANHTMTANDRTKLPVVGKAATTGHMTLTYHERMHLDVVSVSVGVQTSTDLVNWATTNATTTQTGTDSDGDAIMVVDVPAPTSGAEFIRLNVTQE
jgi:cyclophilin family peptidyl-prolyl cis-trans isomerase